MKTIVLCRHAKSDWPPNVDDFDRPLKGRGIKDANFLGNLLHEKEFTADLIISSPANRALSTAKIIGRHIGYEDKIDKKESIYYQGVSNLISVVKKLPDELDSVMIFGHNPTMENAVMHLLQSRVHFEMPTSGMACFEIYGQSWKSVEERYTHLRWLLIPRLKRKED